MIIGAQLYTVRNYCTDLNSLSETLKKIADIGYTAVQVSGTCKYDAQWLKNELDKNGLVCPITHTAPDRILNETDMVASEHDIFGAKHVGLGAYLFSSENTYSDFLAKYRPAAKRLSELGKYFMYHNHAHEFAKIDGELILEKIRRDCSPDELGFTLDTYWVQVGGADPAAWLDRLKGRVPCIHLKDYSYDTDKKMAVVGEGNLNWDRIFKSAEASGTKYMFVEQDDCYGEDPFECLKRSYSFLSSMGFK